MNNIVFNPSGLYLKDTYYNIPKIPELTLESLEDPPDYIRSINFPLSAEAEFTIETEIDGPTLSRFLRDPYRDHNRLFTVTYEAAYQEQARRHKKKRINKKWAKRYGYVTKFRKVTLDNVQIECCEPDILGEESKYVY